MPKVTDKYLTERKDFILECTNEVLKEKPLYLISMRDIIKKAGVSQGAIYRYYANIDEIYVDLINKNTTYNLLEQEIDSLLDSEQEEKLILYNCIIAIGKYIEELLKTVGGKTCFELLVFYAYDNEKRNTIFPLLKFKQSLEYAQNKIVDYMTEKIKNNVLHPSVSVDSMIMFVSISIDGIAQSVAMSTLEENNQDKKLSLNSVEMFQLLAKAIINFFE